MIKVTKNKYVMNDNNYEFDRIIGIQEQLLVKLLDKYEVIAMYRRKECQPPLFKEVKIVVEAKNISVALERAKDKILKEAKK